jgi:hypothetical protein
MFVTVADVEFEKQFIERKNGIPRYQGRIHTSFLELS